MKIKFSIEVAFPDIHDNPLAISVCSGLQAHGSLTTIAKQFSVKAKAFVTYLLYQHGQYATFDRKIKTDVMIITLGKSVTRAI